MTPHADAPMPHLQEARRILDMAGGDRFRALNLLESQMNVLHQRGQILMSLAGVVVTVTGFSGRIIAGTSPLGRTALVTGLAVVLLSAVWVFAGVMRVRWISEEWMAHDDPAEALALTIARRERKTRAYSAGGSMLCCGLAIYGLAVAIMLLEA